MKFIAPFFLFIYFSISILGESEQGKNYTWITGGLKSFFVFIGTDCSCAGSDCNQQTLTTAIPFTIKYSYQAYNSFHLYGDFATIYQKIELQDSSWSELYFMPRFGVVFGGETYIGVTIGFPLFLDTEGVNFNTAGFNIIFGSKMVSNDQFLSFDIVLGSFSTFGGGSEESGISLTIDIGFGFIF